MPDIESNDTVITLTSADAERVLQIQDTIIAAVRSATEAHKAATTRIAALEDDKAKLTARVAELEANAANVVDPHAVRPVLAGAVAASQAALSPASDSAASAPTALKIVIGSPATPSASPDVPSPQA